MRVTRTSIAISSCRRRKHHGQVRGRAKNDLGWRYARLGSCRPASGVDMLVSVIMPVYNAERTMRKSIESVLQQTMGKLELILIDDASRDGSASIIEGFVRHDQRVKAIRQPANAGVAEARNAGIRAASGTHIALLDSDDWWHPRKLELQLGRMQEARAMVSYTAYQRVAEDGRLLSRVDPPPQV